MSVQNVPGGTRSDRIRSNTGMDFRGITQIFDRFQGKFDDDYRRVRELEYAGMLALSLLLVQGTLFAGVPDSGSILFLLLALPLLTAVFIVKAYGYAFTAGTQFVGDLGVFCAAAGLMLVLLRISIVDMCLFMISATCIYGALRTKWWWKGE